MKEVDVRGLSCPEPILLTQEALKEGKPIKILVSEPHQKNNIEKFIKELGKSYVTKENNRIFEIVIK